MTVYVLRWAVDYGDDELIGVFASEESAVDRARQDATAIGETLDEGTRFENTLRIDAGSSTHYTVTALKVES